MTTSLPPGHRLPRCQRVGRRCGMISTKNGKLGNTLDPSSVLSLLSSHPLDLTSSDTLPSGFMSTPTPSNPSGNAPPNPSTRGPFLMTPHLMSHLPTRALGPPVLKNPASAPTTLTRLPTPPTHNPTLRRRRAVRPAGEPGRPRAHPQHADAAAGRLRSAGIAAASRVKEQGIGRVVGEVDGQEPWRLRPTGIPEW